MNREIKIEDLEKEYSLNLKEIVGKIIKAKSKKVLLQVPEGLKIYSIAIKKKLEDELKKSKYNAQIFIWMDSCFGACDLPLETEKLCIDLIVHIGHSEFKK
jgi:2-(3-amino-3-carboxypropyl)histidine synthase